MDEGKTERETRAGQNQALFREVNERLEGLAQTFQFVAETATFACECADTRCVAQLSLTLGEYEALRANPTHFAVLPGHILPDVEDVVSTGERYVVVAKRDAAAEVAKAADPRAAAATASSA